MIIEMEERTCAGDKCQKTFKVSHNSPQLYHSNFCALNDPKRAEKTQKWTDSMKKLNQSHFLLEQQKRKSERGTVKETNTKSGNTLTTLNTELNKMKGEEIAQKPQNREIAIERKKDMNEIKPKTMPVVQKIEEKISREIESTTGTTMQTTASESLPESNSNDTKMILPADSSPSSKILREGVLDSLSLIDDSMKLMSDSAKGLMQSSKGEGIDEYKVKTAVQCVAEMRNLMRVKLDIAKLGLEIYGPVNGKGK